jgi:hypothetical protein
MTESRHLTSRVRITTLHTAVDVIDIANEAAFARPVISPDGSAGHLV